jgi:excisionase family DNA binding protein
MRPGMNRPAHAGRDPLLTIPEVIERLQVPRSTFYRWRQLGMAPASIKLPNGQVRIRESALDDWLRHFESEPAA